jgi:hypothetical protein
MGNPVSSSEPKEFPSKTAFLMMRVQEFQAALIESPTIERWANASVNKVFFTSKYSVYSIGTHRYFSIKY